MRKGGTTNSIRQIVVWLIILTLLFLAGLNNYRRIASNYTDLHKRVYKLERHCYAK